MFAKYGHTCAFAVALACASTAHASASEPSDANASVPAMQYDSAFKGYQPAAEPTTSPDKAWRAANQAVTAPPEQGSMVNMPTNGSMEIPTQTPVARSKAGSIPRDKGVAMPTPEGASALPGMDMPQMDMPHDKHREGQ
jgi:hypothetical protein